MMLLVGAGSHAQRLVTLFDLEPTHYVAPEYSTWLWDPGKEPLRFGTDDAAIASLEPGMFVMGMGGVRPDALARRRALIARYRAAGWKAASLQDVSAIIHRKTIVQDGVHVLNGAIVSPHAVLKRDCLVNCGAIVEHHALIGEGTHIGPGAVVLGNVTIGDGCMIGANATIIEGSTVPPGTMVKAGTVWMARAVSDDEFFLGHEHYARTDDRP